MDLIALIGSGLIGLIVGILAIIALVGKGSWGNSLRGVLGAIPIGKPKIWAALLLVVALVGGGLSFASISAATGSLFNGASVIGTTSSSAVVGAQNLQCQFASVALVGASVNAAVRADSTNLQHYYLDVKEQSGNSSVNGTMTCYRSGDINSAAKSTCQVSSDTFKNEISTTDSNTYSILASSASPSVVPGVTWAQTAYLNDGSIATTSSDKEQTDLIFAGGASATSKRTLGFYMTLPGNTVWGYLNNQTARSVYIKCDGKQVGYLTVNKVAGN